jgi:hypothetical protein
MANDTVSNTDLFPACSEVLDRALLPLHYRDLTIAGLHLLRVPIQTVNMVRQMEDVREKMLEAGRFGTAYLPAPHCMGYKRSWLPAPMPALINTMTPIQIASNIQASEDALYEGLRRNPYMINKYNIPWDSRARKRSRGLLIESHVRQWFQQRYPNLYQPPANHQRWQQPCDHDFQLVVYGKAHKVDVMGPALDSTLQFAAGKHITDVHLVAGIQGNAVMLYGGGLGKDFAHINDLDTTRSILPLLTMLNCAQAGLHYFALFGLR